LASTYGDFAYDLPSGNNTRIYGGSISITGGGAKFGTNKAKAARDVSGYKTKSLVTVTMLSGTNTITGNHGLDNTPSTVIPISRNGNNTGFSSGSYTSTQFLITKSGNATQDTNINCICLAPEEFGL
jgi:hypothetical protein